jgi:hypothetical protein
MTDFRALCAELVDALAEWQLGGAPPEDTADADLITRARELMAESDGPAVSDDREPASVALQPSDEEVAELVAELNRICFDVAPRDADTITRAATLLQQQAAPVPVLPDDAQIIEPAEHILLVPVAQPVPVSERLPGPEDCDEQGRCWWFDDDDEKWCLDTPYMGARLLCWTHWLPANALPTPEALDD